MSQPSAPPDNPVTLDDEMVFNGIDATTGRYLFEPVTLERMAQRIEGHQEPKGWLARIKSWYAERMMQDYPIPFGTDPTDLAQTGWAVVFAPGRREEMREALAPLLELRREQAGGTYEEGGRYLEVEYLPEMGSEDLLATFGQAPAGLVDPARFPYHVLLAGSLEEIPLSFQVELDVQYSVGRLAFEETESYATYAARVVEAVRSDGEKTPSDGSSSRLRAGFWAVRNDGDRATEKSHTQMMIPLMETLDEVTPGWSFDGSFGADATRSRLLDLTSGPDAPEFLFTASHGIGFPAGDSRQRAHQGAPICQEWAGPGHPVERDQYLAAEDLPSSGPSPRVAFLFACYGGATPTHDEFWFQSGIASRNQIAPRPFVAGLPQRLLERGTLAVVAHADRAWTWSFSWGGLGPQLTTFESVVRQIHHGLPIGHATENLDTRYAEVTARIERLRQKMAMGMTIDRRELVALWTAGNDARNYIVLGDPAVRLRKTT